MRLEFGGAIGVALHIGAIGKTLAEQHMHDAAGKGAVGARPQQDLDVGLLHGVVVVDVDRRDPGAAFFPRAHRMRHHIDLGVHGIGAPDHDQVGDAHLARIDAGDLAGADGKTDAGDVGADGRVEAGIFLHMRKAVDAVAHHQPHGAGIVIRPNRFSPELALGRVEPIGDLVERLVPGNPRELARSPSAQCGAADTSAGPGDGCARHSGRPWRRRPRRYRSAAWSRAPGRWWNRRSPRHRARRPTGNHADRSNAGYRSWPAGS